MRIFVAGATGVLGKRAVRELVAAGHEVSAVARNEEKAALLRSLGVVCVLGVVVPGDDKPFGLLGVQSTRWCRFSDQDVHFLRSVANVTRRDAEEFVALAVQANVRAEYKTYPLDAANDALAAIAADSVRGSAVLEIA